MFWSNNTVFIKTTNNPVNKKNKNVIIFYSSIFMRFMRKTLMSTALKCWIGYEYFNPLLSDTILQTQKIKRKKGWPKGDWK